jgi:lipoate-protein ligase A
LDNIGVIPGRIIVQQPLDGAFNMAADEILLEQAVREQRVILRLFQWDPWAVSLGKHQSLNRVDTEACRRKKVMVVRRLTGGRAVLHARELTYSIYVPTNNDRAGFHHDIALQVGQAICQGLRSLDADVEWVPKGRSVLGQRTSLCFASVARGEIVWRGKKVVGSAQRVLNNAILQHGSILMDHGHEQIADLFLDSRNRMTNILISHTATLREILGKVPSYSETTTSLVNGFRQYFGGLNVEEELSHDETRKIAQRANSFYLGGWEMGTVGMYTHADGCAA